MQGHDEDMSELDEGDAPAVDMFAALFEARGWPCELAGEDELAAEVKGSWTSYQLRVIAREDDNVVQILVLPDITVPEDLRVRMYEAVGLINEQLWLGHFDLWSANGILLMRHGALLGPGGMLGLDQAQVLVDAAIDECERFYPVFQFIIWGGKTPQEAIDAALIDTAGEA